MDQRQKETKDKDIDVDVYSAAVNPTNLPPRWSYCNLPAVVFSTAITKKLNST